jgi:hypothetical protein
MRMVNPSKEIAEEDDTSNRRNIERKIFKSGLSSVLRIGREFTLCIAVALLSQFLPPYMRILKCHLILMRLPNYTDFN